MKLTNILLFIVTVLLFIKEIKTIEILELDNFENVYQGYPQFSNVEQCTFSDIRFLVKDSEINGGIDSFSTTGSVQLTNNILKSEGPCSIYQLSSSQSSLQQGIHSFQIIATSKSLVTTTLDFNFTCNKPDYTNLSVVTTSPNLISNGDNFCAPVQIVGINFTINYLISEFNNEPGTKSTQGSRNFFCIPIQSKNLIEDTSSSYSYNHLFYIDSNVGIKKFPIIYLNSPLLGKTNVISNVVTYPYNDGSRLFEMLGYGLSPLITFTSNSNEPLPYQYLWDGNNNNVIPIPSYGNKGNLTYIVQFIGMKNELAHQNSIKYFDLEMKNQTIVTNVKLFNVNNIPQINVVTNNYYPGIPLHQQSLILVDYNYYPLIFRYGSNYLQLFWPFGFKSGSKNQIIYSFDFQQAQLEAAPSQTFCGMIYISTTPSCVPISPVGSGLESNPPTIESYQFIHLVEEVYRLIITVVDQSGVSTIKSASFLQSSIGSGSLIGSLISGDIYNGTYEFLCSINAEMSIILTDTYQNTITIYKGTYITLNADGAFLYYDYPTQIINRQFTYANFQSITFENNNLNLTNDGNSYNTMYIVSNDIHVDTIMFLILLDPLSVNIESSFVYFWPITYDASSLMFICDFILPKNSIFGKMGYIIQVTPGNLVRNTHFPDNFQLNVNDSYFDNSPPLFTSFTKVYGQSGNEFNSTLIGWSFEIEDNVGFDNGYFKVVGSTDNSIYHFNFTNDDSNNGVFSILVNTTNPCISQSYKIIYAELFDVNGVNSVFELFPTIVLRPTKNPFRNYLDVPDINVISFVCPNIMQSDPSAPVLTEFISSLPNGSIVVNSDNRNISFEFQLEDGESGIKISQLPIIYIQSNKLELHECISKLLWVQDKVARYTCDTRLPFGFGYPGILTFSIYGLVNNGGYFGGYSTADLLLSYNVNSFVNTSIMLNTFGLSPTIISNQRITSKGGRLILYGYSFERVIGLTIKFLDDIYGYDIPFTPTIINPTSIIIDNIPTTTKPYIVVLKTLDVKSNEHKVVPIYFNTVFIQPPYSPTPSVTTTPTPTSPNRETKCIGNPECGGKDNGYCNSNFECICYPPWVGIDCLSKVIVVPKPNINNTNPSTEIPIIDDKDVTKYLFKSLISLVSIRELDYNFLQVNSFTFDKWIYTEINSKKNKYFTNITIVDLLNNNQVIGITNITVYLEWFDKLTNIEFANLNLTMNPSTIKYTIEITKYPFSSTLNHLQLIMSASFKSSNTNTCSLNSFGETSLDGDNYLKIQIDDHSLYGRFIKRAIIDEKVETISNKLLDSSFNEVTNQDPDNLQPYIGITVPNFKVSAIIDPDFSILFDSVPASNYEESICLSPPSSKLTSSQLAGIIIGSIAFAAVIVISLTYYLVKKKQNSKFLNSIGNKLKSIE